MATQKKAKSNKLTEQPKKMMHEAKKIAKKAGSKGGATMLGAAAGTVVGAAIGGAAGAALVNKDARQKLAKGITEFSQTAVDTLDRINESTATMAQKARNTLNEVEAGQKS